jgi:hypothetical protein
MADDRMRNYDAMMGATPASPVADDGLPPLPKALCRDDTEHYVDYYSADQLRQAQRESYEAGRQAGKPNGWKLVPVEPTQAMITAGYSRNLELGGAKRSPDETYRAMLTAAPQPQKDDT